MVNTSKRVAAFLLVVFFLVGTAVALSLVKQRQVIEERATAPSVSCPGLREDTCGAEGYDIKLEGEWNESTQTLRTWGHYGFNPVDPNKCCPNIGKQRQYYVEILHCLNNDPNKCSYADATRVAGGCKTLTISGSASCGKGDFDWDFTVGCGRYQVDVCEGGTCANPVYGYQVYHACPAATATPVASPTPSTPPSECRLSFVIPSPTPTPTSTPTVTPTPTPTPTLTPTSTPTATPMPTITSTPTPTTAYYIRCLYVRVYNASWQVIADLSTLRPGQAVYLTVKGETNHPLGITKARFRMTVNNVAGNWQETAQKNSTGEFYVSYTVASFGTYEVEGMVYNSYFNSWY